MFKFSNILKGKNFTDFAYKRSLKGAIGFYLIYLLFTIFNLMIITLVMQLLKLPDSISLGMVVLVYTITMVYIVWKFLNKKNLMKQIKYIVLAIIAVILTLLHGFIIALIIPAYFSTLEKKE